jgi:hypothetical protein
MIECITGADLAIAGVCFLSGLGLVFFTGLVCWALERTPE